MKKVLSMVLSVMLCMGMLLNVAPVAHAATTYTLTIENTTDGHTYEAYQIFSGTRHPERKKLLCLAVGMSLNLEETQTLLKCAGYAPLYVKMPFDSVVIYGVCKQLSVIEINEILFDNHLETLG